VGVCPRCSVEGDRTPKPLRRCPFCGEYFCEEHAEPRLAMSFQVYQRYLSQYRDIADEIRKHWQSKGGHPCTTFTHHFWRKYEERARAPTPARAELRAPPVWVRPSPPYEEETVTLPVFEPFERAETGVAAEVPVRRFRRESYRTTLKKLVKAALAVVILVLLLAYMLPLLYSDQDGDGLPFIQELQLGTNPFRGDTDGDGLPDGYEVRIGTNPLRDWKAKGITVEGFDADVVRSGLSKFYRSRVAWLARTLAGATDVEKVWNVLEWVDSNIEYDHGKASSSGARVFSPDETVQARRGVCADYALLTASLLLEAGVKEVYVLDIEVRSLGGLMREGHVSVAVVISGETYVLDQHLPPLRLENYLEIVALRQYAIIGGYLLNLEPDRRAEIKKVYRVTLDNEGEPVVTEVEPRMLPSGHVQVDEKRVRDLVLEVLREVNPRLLPDEDLSKCASLMFLGLQCTLPPRYTGGECYSIEIPEYLLSRDFLHLYLRKLILNGEVLTKATHYNRVGMHASEWLKALKLIICFARA
jgi:transglutaminase-like putative cysteine protease